MKAYLLFSLILLSSCSPKFEKALEVVTKTPSNAKVAQEEIHSKHPMVTAEAAARWYAPAITEGPTTTVTEPGNTQELKQEIQQANIKSDSLQRLLEAQPSTAPLEEKVSLRDRIITELRARIASLNSLASNLKADLERITSIRYQENTAAIEAGKMREEKARIREGGLVAALQLEQDQHEKTKAELHEVKKMLIWTRLGIGLLVLTFIAVGAITVYGKFRFL